MATITTMDGSKARPTNLMDCRRDAPGPARPFLQPYAIQRSQEVQEFGEAQVNLEKVPIANVLQGARSRGDTLHSLLD
jgi:hypothetical protein